MPTRPVNRALAQLCRTVLVPHGAGASDGQLLTAFVERRDEIAFETLLRRHGPMVLGVCRRMLGNDHDADDAFQAAFLVLVRKAASVVPREALANWLYGVAYQTAVRARSVAAKRRGREKQVTPMPEPSTIEPDVWSDLQPLLDRELRRLPDTYRLPVVLCDLEGKTRKEAAQQLGWPEGSLSGRLARARALLAKRLTRHGVALSAGALAALLTEHAASAAVPAAVTAATLNAAKLGAAGAVATPVAILVEGVVKAMLLAKLKTIAMVAALAVFGAAVVTCAALARGQDEGAKPQDRPLQQAPRAAGDAAPAAPKKSPLLDGLSAHIVSRGLGGFGGMMGMGGMGMMGMGGGNMGMMGEGGMGMGGGMAGMMGAGGSMVGMGGGNIGMRGMGGMGGMGMGGGMIYTNLDAALILTNEGKSPLRVCTWFRQETLREDTRRVSVLLAVGYGKTKPDADRVTKKIVTLQPGKSTTLPITLTTIGTKTGSFTLTASYSVSAEFGKQFNVWHGKIDAPSLEIAVGKAPAKRLSLEAEAHTRNGKPYVKVYLVNPSNIALAIVDHHENTTFPLDSLVAVTTDGHAARLMRKGVGVKAKGNRKPLPAESKTLLGVLAFDDQTAASFGGNTPTVVLDVTGAPKPLPLAAGKHTLIIRPAASDLVQYPAAVQPATVTVEIPDAQAKRTAMPGIKATVRGILHFDGSKGLSAYVAVAQGRQKEETRVWFWMSEGEWKYWRDRMPALDGKEITVHGDLAQLPAGSHSSIPPRALYFQRFDIEGPEDVLIPRPR